MSKDTVTLAGLMIVLGAFLAYFAMLFLLRRFTYRTWIFNAAVVAGMSLALLGFALGGNRLFAGLALAIGGAWFVATWSELRIRGSSALKVRVGDALPAFSAVTTDGRSFSNVEVMAAAPALLVLYRGWWCPSSKVQLDDLLSHYAELSRLGLKLFAGSVDGPEESAPMQEHVGSTITILGAVDVSFLDAVGVRDRRGAPWYDRLWFGAKSQPIAMPAAIAVARNGRITFAERSTRIDDRPSPAALIASLTPTAPTSAG